MKPSFCVWWFLLVGAPWFNEAANITVNVTETDAGVDIPNTSGLEDCTLPSISGGVNLTKYFNLTDSGTLQLVNPLDLEVLVASISSPIIQFTMNCEKPSHSQLEVLINIQPVNEFHPNFVNAPYSASILENMPAHTFVFSVTTQDNDAFKYNIVSNFSFVKYPIEEFDGREYFTIDRDTGNITAKQTFDYEALKRSFFMFFIKAMDDGGFESPSQISLNISITDADDMPPVFVRRSCTVNCGVTSYTGAIDWYHEGPIFNIQPDLVHAIDGDRGVNIDVSLSIVDVHPAELADTVRMNSSSGEITVTEPFVNISGRPLKDPFQIRLTLQAQEISNSKHSSNTTLTLYVYQQLPTTVLTRLTPTTMPTAEEEPEEKPDWLVIIMTPTILGVILLIIIGVLLLRKRQRMIEKKRYKVRESQKETKLRPPSIGAISATQINPYELVDNYAHMDLTERPSFEYGDGNQQPEPEGGYTEVAGNATDDKIIEGMYARVDRRKQKTKKSKIPEFSEQGGYTNVLSMTKKSKIPEISEQGGYINVLSMTSNEDPDLPVDKDLPPDIKPFEFSEENMHY